MYFIETQLLKSQQKEEYPEKHSGYHNDLWTGACDLSFSLDVMMMPFAFWICFTLETSLICILLLASRDVQFDKRKICFLSDLL